MIFPLSPPTVTLLHFLYYLILLHCYFLSRIYPLLSLLSLLLAPYLPSTALPYISPLISIKTLFFACCFIKLIMLSVDVTGGNTTPESSPMNSPIKRGKGNTIILESASVVTAGTVESLVDHLTDLKYITGKPQLLSLFPLVSCSWHILRYTIHGILSFYV